MNPYPSGQGDNIWNIWQKGLHLLLRYRMDLTGIVVLITVSWASANETREPFGAASYGKMMVSYGKMLQNKVNLSLKMVSQAGLPWLCAHGERFLILWILSGFFQWISGVGLFFPPCLVSE